MTELSWSGRGRGREKVVGYELDTLAYGRIHKTLNVLFFLFFDTHTQSAGGTIEHDDLPTRLTHGMVLVLLVATIYEKVNTCLSITSQK